MKTHFSLLVISFILLLTLSGNAQVNKTTEALRSKLVSINRQIADAFLKEDINKLMKHYAPDAVSMPEYQPMMKGSDAIRIYFQEIMDRQQIKSFDKKIRQVMDLKGNIVEIGSFTIVYIHSKNEQPFKHNGKYLNIWKVQADGTLRLKAESYGYFEAIENPANLTFTLPKKATESSQVQWRKDN